MSISPRDAKRLLSLQIKSTLSRAERREKKRLKKKVDAGLRGSIREIKAGGHAGYGRDPNWGDREV